MKKRKEREWTEEENNLLLQYYYTLSEGPLKAILPTRNLSDMQRQVAFLKRKNYTFYGDPDGR